MSRIPNDLLEKQRTYPNSVGNLLQLFKNAYDNWYDYISQIPFEQPSRRTRLKQDENLTEYQNEGRRAVRSIENDRQFPLETVMIQSHRLGHGADVNKAIIHTGMTADEYARSFNALALTIGSDIFFRNGAYRPETEAGRKLLAHELTHISQYEEGRVTAGKDVKELEDEAELNEKLEEHDGDPIEEVEICGEVFYLSRSEQKEVIRDVIEMLKEKFEEQKIILSETEFAGLLIAFEKWKTRRCYW